MLLSLSIPMPVSVAMSVLRKQGQSLSLDGTADAQTPRLPLRSLVSCRAIGPGCHQTTPGHYPGELSINESVTEPAPSLHVGSDT